MSSKVTYRLLMLSMAQCLAPSKYKYFCCSLHYVLGADRVYRFSSELILFKLCLDGVTSLTCSTYALVLVVNSSKSFDFACCCLGLIEYPTYCIFTGFVGNNVTQ